MKKLLLTCLIFVFSIELSISQQITFNEGTNFGVSVSPDDSSIALDLQGILWVLPKDGGVAEPVTSGQQPEVREPNWSPDGTKIAFQGFKGGYFHIWVYDVEEKTLKQYTDGRFDDREPMWHPDGDKILFSSDRTGNYDIWQLNFDTKELTQITDHPHDDAHPSISNDGEKILYTREIRGRYSEILLLEDGAEVSVLRSSTTTLLRPSWSTDNKGFSYIASTGNIIKLNHIANVDSRKAQVNVTTIDEGDVFPFRSSWSEKNEIYYTADGLIKKKSIMDDGFEAVPFTATITANKAKPVKKNFDFSSKTSKPVLGIGSLDISPRNNEMVFTALGDMWLQSENDKKPTNIFNSIGHVVDPTWSFDGSKIAFVAERNGQMDIWIRDVETGEERQITNDKDREYRLSWSRDDGAIAYLSTRSISNTWGRADLKVVDVKFGFTNLIDKTIFTPGRPVWTPDNRNILLAVSEPATTRFREGYHAIRRYSVETHRAELVDLPTPFGLSTRDGSGPVIAPDGKRMSVVSEGELKTFTISKNGDVKEFVDSQCTETAHMPRWNKDSKTISYFSGNKFRSCNIDTGETQTLSINLEWKRAVANDKTLHVGKLFDAVRNDYITNVDVFISENVITKILPHGQEPAIGEFIDYSDKTVIPGIIAAHSHQSEIMGERLGRNWLAYGITTVRDPGTNPYKGLMRKETWGSGISMGPRLFHSGWLTGGARIYYGQSYNAITEKALMHEMKRARELDYDLLKSYVRLSDEFQQVLVKTGNELGIPVTSHEIAPAIQNGVYGVEHMGATSRRGYSPKISSISRTYNDVHEIISQSGLTITPTGTLTSGFAQYVGMYPEYVNQPRSKTFLDSMQRDGLMSMQYSPRTLLAQDRNKSVLATFKTLLDKGANIAAGTDSPFIPYGLAQIYEIVMFDDAGFGPVEAIKTSTINAAKLIGVDQYLGTIEVGKIADMVVLDGNPLVNITDIFNVEATIKDGHVYTKEEMIIDRGQMK